MAFIVETGSGTPGANSYASTAFVTSYLTDRGRATQNGWSTLSSALQQAALVAATDYIDVRYGSLFLGSRARELIAGRAASGSVTLGSVPLDTETVTVGQRVYRFSSALTQADDVLIGLTAAASMSNLIAAVNAPGANAAVVHEDTFPNYEVVAADLTTSVEFYAQTRGESGNLIALATGVTGGTVTGSVLAGGVDQGPQPLAFPRSWLYSAGGTLVAGVPSDLKRATAEYAVRAVSAVLSPDPTFAASLVGVQRKREKVGPIEEETEYVAGGIAFTFVAYPAADRLLSAFLSTSGRGGARAIRG